MKTSIGLVVWLAVLLAGCANHMNDPYTGPVAKPQVAYRIDDHRFFEVVPLEKFACARARLYYTDTARGIDRKSTRLNSSHERLSRMPSSA